MSLYVYMVRNLDFFPMYHANNQMILSNEVTYTFPYLAAMWKIYWKDISVDTVYEIVVIVQVRELINRLGCWCWRWRRVPVSRFEKKEHTINRTCWYNRYHLQEVRKREVYQKWLLGLWFKQLNEWECDFLRLVNVRNLRMDIICIGEKIRFWFWTW